jgi:lipopolysaccharide export system protein LptA
MGVYKKGGKLVRSKTTLKSTEGVYYGITRDVIFRKKVELIDPENSIYTDTLEYNTYSQLSNFISPTKVISGSRIIRTTNGNYNTASRKGYLYERSSIDDSTYTFISDEMAINDSLEIGEFRGNAILRTKDSLSFDMMANNIKSDRKNSILLATEMPMLLIKQPKDTLYIHADTLYSAKIAQLKRAIPASRDSVSILQDTTKNKYFEAFHNVIIYSDSLQARCDSLFYSMADSTIRLLGHPIVWTNNNQITGDTIYLYINNKKPEGLKVFNNAFAINKLDSVELYNQMRGNQILVWFQNGSIAKMVTKGNAESIYFVQDDHKDLIGMNSASAQIMEVNFEDGEPAKVKWINQLNGILTPIKKVKKDQQLFKNFKWEETIRPKNKFEVLSPTH